MIEFKGYESGDYGDKNTLIFENPKTAKRLYVDNVDDWGSGEVYREIYPIGNPDQFNLFLKEKGVKDFSEFSFKALYYEYIKKHEREV